MRWPVRTDAGLTTAGGTLGRLNSPIRTIGAPAEMKLGNAMPLQDLYNFLGDYCLMRSIRTVTGPGRSKIETSPVTCPSTMMPGEGTLPSR